MASVEDQKESEFQVGIHIKRDNKHTVYPVALMYHIFLCVGVLGVHCRYVD